jgi:hypothetical protein
MRFSRGWLDAAWMFLFCSLGVKWIKRALPDDLHRRRGGVGKGRSAGRRPVLNL